MSWPEIKKAVNSDISTPLNHLIWLNDYRIFGEESYVFQNKDTLHELYEDYKLCMNALPIQAEAFDYVVTNNTEVGKALASCEGITDADILAGLTTVDAVVSNNRAMAAVAANETAMRAMIGNETTNDAMFNSSTAMNAVVNSEVAMGVVAYNETVLNKFVNSETSMNAVVNSEVAMGAVAGSSVAMNIFANNDVAVNKMVTSNVAMTEISKSLTAMEQVTTTPKMVVAIAKNTANWTTTLKKNFFTAVCATKALVVNMYKIIFDSTYFQNKYSTYVSTPSYADQYGTAEYAANGFVACAIGRNGSDTSSTSMLIDGELIIKSNEYNAPTSVSTEQINAIGCPTATFTADGNGWVAIEVFVDR